jgi:hypothetical protein
MSNTSGMDVSVQNAKQRATKRMIGMGAYVRSARKNVMKRMLGTGVLAKSVKQSEMNSTYLLSANAKNAEKPTKIKSSILGS